MKILLFTEIYDSGGIDTFIINLISSWPKNDEFIIFSNPNYPGLERIENFFGSRVKIIKNNLFLYKYLYDKNIGIKILSKFFSPIAKYFILLINSLTLRDTFKELKCDKLMVINGGYPGGDSCRSAIIGWQLAYSDNSAILNCHNLASKPPIYLYFQELFIDYLISKSIKNIIAVSGSCAKSFQIRPQLFRSSRIDFIYNGIDVVPLPNVDIDEMKKSFGFSKDHQVCLMLGTYEPRKGHYFLLASFAKVVMKNPNARLLIAGYGTDSEIAFVRTMLKDFNLEDYVVLSNFRKDASSLIQMSEILLISSQEYESFGYTSVEAMAHKKPVVATNIGGIPEVISNGNGGFLTSPSDVEAYSEQIIKLLNNEEERQCQGLLGYERYSSIFRAKSMSDQYYRFLNQE